MTCSFVECRQYGLLRGFLTDGYLQLSLFLGRAHSVKIKTLSSRDPKFVINEALNSCGTFFSWQNQNVSMTFKTDENPGICRRPDPGCSSQERGVCLHWPVKGITDAPAAPSVTPRLEPLNCDQATGQLLSVWEAFRVFPHSGGDLHQAGLRPGVENTWCATGV